MNQKLEGVDAVFKAVAIFASFIGFNAALNSFRASQGLLPPGEHILLLRSINAKLGKVAGDEAPTEDIDYYEVL